MTSHVYRFGAFRLDPAIRELWRDGEEVLLSPKAFGCLAYLLEHRDRAVGRDELISTVWGKMALTDSVVNHAILAARRALGDTGDEHQFIKTVPGFGYRWVAPVEVTVPGGTQPLSPLDRRTQRWLPAAGLGLVLAVLITGALSIWRNTDVVPPDREIRPVSEQTIGILLPVDVGPESQHQWIRFGVMELVAERLRDAGQPMVPSETVIALTRGSAAIPTDGELETLTAVTGAQLVFSARAQPVGARWRISLHSLTKQHAPLTAFAEAEDVLEAAATAADDLAQLLGLTPASRSDAEPELVQLLQQIEAARLAQQFSVARTLIEQAKPRYQAHPDLRFQRARIEYYNDDLDTTQQILETLLEDIAQDHYILRARVLNGLAAVHTIRGDHHTARPLVQAAIELFGEDDATPILGLTRTHLGALLLEAGDFDGAWEHLAQARRIQESIGNVLGVASVDLNMGALSAGRERYGDAIRYFERSAGAMAAAHDIGGELNALSRIMRTYLFLLDLDSASAIERRVSELLDQSNSPRLEAHVNLYRAYLLDALGQITSARALLEDILAAHADAEEDLFVPRISASVRLAEYAYRDGDPRLAADIATDVVAKLTADHRIVQNYAQAQAWLLLVRAHLALDNLPAATGELAAMRAWSDSEVSISPKIHAALAAAEIAAIEGRGPDARGAYEQALALADDTQTPLYLLQVTQSYVPWLLAQPSSGGRDIDHALGMVARLSAHTDTYYDAALLQLRVYHTSGPPSAWRQALSRAQLLAAEREIPPELLLPR